MMTSYVGTTSHSHLQPESVLSASLWKISSKCRALSEPSARLSVDELISEPISLNLPGSNVYDSGQKAIVTAALPSEQ
jgi:hypothetical protein